MEPRQVTAGSWDMDTWAGMAPQAAVDSCHMDILVGMEPPDFHTRSFLAQEQAFVQAEARQKLAR
jgi:hypothetical protein